jgi:hypothetical protein
MAGEDDDPRGEVIAMIRGLFALILLAVLVSILVALGGVGLVIVALLLGATLFVVRTVRARG